MNDLDDDELPMRLGLYILDERGNPEPATSYRQWAEWYEASFTNRCRFLADTKISDSVGVSTIFLGTKSCSPSMDDFEIAYLFESMVFGGPFDRLQRRYKTKEEALEGHKSIVLRVTGDSLPLAPDEMSIIDQLIAAAKENRE